MSVCQYQSKVTVMKLSCDFRKERIKLAFQKWVPGICVCFIVDLQTVKNGCFDFNTRLVLSIKLSL